MCLPISILWYADKKNRKQSKKERGRERERGNGREIEVILGVRLWDILSVFCFNIHLGLRMFFSILNLHNEGVEKEEEEDEKRERKRSFLPFVSHSLFSMRSILLCL